MRSSLDRMQRGLHKVGTGGEVGRRGGEGREEGEEDEDDDGMEDVVIESGGQDNSIDQEGRCRSLAHNGAVMFDQ